MDGKVIGSSMSHDITRSLYTVLGYLIISPTIAPFISFLKAAGFPRQVYQMDIP